MPPTMHQEFIRAHFRRLAEWQRQQRERRRRECQFLALSRFATMVAASGDETEGEQWDV